MGDFEFPTNIKQIGSIGDGLRVYMEDYVYSYLQQYTEAAGYEERLALLVGRDLIIDNQKVLFISGAMQGKYTILEDGILKFTEKSWDYAHDQVDKYFAGLEIVGWMQSQPGYGVSLNIGYARYHTENFILSYQTLFVMDPMEKLNVFYVWSEEPRELIETKGYFIYYDKNRGMHNYMLDNKIINLKLATRDYMPENEKEKPPLEDDVPPLSIHKKIKDKPSEYQRARRAARKGYSGQKRVVNMLVALSSVLFIICFIMGAGLMQNDGRITSLEQQLSLLSSSYSSAVAQIRQDNAEAVFAAQENKPVVQNEQPSEEPLPQPTLIEEDGNLTLAQTQTEILVEPVSTPEPSPEPTPVPLETASPAPIPSAPTEAAALQAIPTTYVVQQGDSLLSISRRFYGTTDMVEKIVEFNQLEDSDKIYFGKVLLLP